ncbi:MAG: hypothetical protein AABW58_00625 [Nanoarchaeota archaeon]
MFIGDLHIHSKYARACSKDITLKRLADNAKLKGLSFLGTGDFQHPKHYPDIISSLQEDSNGILWTKETNPFPFIWQTEISLMYKQDGKGRRIHHTILSPSKAVTDQIIEALGKRGRMDYDGRPIFGFSSIELIEMMRSISEDIEIIPAHCLLPDEKIISNPKINKISEVKIGDKVLTHKGEYRKISKTFKRPYFGEVFEITPYYFTEGIKVTKEHPFLAIKSFKTCSDVGGMCKPNSIAKGKHKCKKEHYKDYQSKWINAENLEMNDILLYPRIKKTISKSHFFITDFINKKEYDLFDNKILPKKGRRTKLVKNKINISQDFCKLIGYYLSEGFVVEKNRSISFAFNKHENKYIKEVIILMKKCFGINISKKEIKNNGCQLIFYSKPLYELFSLLFYEKGKPKRAFSKKIPHWFLYLPKNKQVEIIRCWWRGDTGTTSSELLTTQMKLICLRLGIIPSINKITKEKLNSYNKKIGDRKITASHDSYMFRLSFYQDEFNLLKDVSFIRFKSKLQRRHGWLDREYIYIPIRKIQKRKYCGPVYNLEVENDNSFVTTSATVHNCMTPWFGIFGSMSGFDSFEECFKEKSKFVYAIESGLSADPPMFWRVSKFDKLNIISSSDPHSYHSYRLGREATIFDFKQLTYSNLIKAIRTGEGLSGTIEVDPSYGKYHFDGHRICGLSFSPQESKQHNNICPRCKQKLTIGVQNRIEQLADRPEGFVKNNAKKFHSLLPLAELISVILKKGVSTKTVLQEYNKLVSKFSTELNILMNISFDELKQETHEKIAEAIIRIREGKVKYKPGFDGLYGHPILSEEDEKKAVKEKPEFLQDFQKGLDSYSH